MPRKHVWEVAMRVLVIGAGRMGRLRAQDLVADARVDQVCITNRTTDRADAVAAELGAVSIPWGDIARDVADAYVVTVGTDAHDAVLSQIIPFGKPVLCEKPIALTTAATSAFIALADAHGTPLQIGFQRRYDPGIRAVRDRIARGDLGTLYALAMQSRDHSPSDRAFIAGSGGIFRDLHVHDFDLVRWLTDSEVASVFARSAVREHVDYRDFDDADVSAILATTTSGVEVSIQGARHDALGHDVRLEVFGSKDSAAAGLNERTPIRTMDGSLALPAEVYRDFIDRFRDAFALETRAFVSFAVGDAPNPCPPQSALESLRIAIACERSIATGAPVDVAEVR